MCLHEAGQLGSADSQGAGFHQPVPQPPHQEEGPTTPVSPLSLSCPTSTWEF